MKVIWGASALAALTFAAFCYLVLGRPLPPDQTAIAVNLSSAAVAAGAALATAFASLRLRGRVRIAWTFIALSLASWAIGQAIWTYYEVVLGQEVPFPSASDAGYLLFIPLAIAGLVLMPSAATTLGLRARTIVDGLIIAGSLFVLSWHTLLDDIVASGGGGLPFVIALAYPVGDVLLATWVVLLATNVRGEGRGRWWLLGLGMLAFAISDSAFLYLTSTEAYATGSAADIGWVAGLLLLAVAAIIAAYSPRAAPHLDARTTDAAMIMPYVPFGIAIVFLAAETARGGFGPALFWSLTSLALLVMLRQLLAMLDNLQLTRRLELANDRLTESERTRIRLLNTITHDLLNPLTPMRLQVHLLEIAKPPLPQGQQRSLDVVKRNIELLQRLVLDVKDLARLEGGKLALVTESVDVSQVASHAIETFAPLASERGVTIRSEIAPGVVLLGDRGRLTQIVFNLVSNALKFTPRGGEVAIGVEGDGRAGRLYVRDTGRGLTEDEIGRLFKPFSQVHAPHETPERGTGLGLFLSRAIAEQHGGSLAVESPGHGRGSTFTLRLPREPHGGLA